MEDGEDFGRLQLVQRLARKPGLGSDGADVGAFWAGAGVTGAPLRWDDEDSILVAVNSNKKNSHNDAGGLLLKRKYK